MDPNVRNEINSCIRELSTIVRELYAVADDVEACINGMNTRTYTRTLKNCAEKYDKAARKLKRIE